jgi:predicted kinase
MSMIVLVTGLQGSGKSTVAEGCADLLGAPVFAWDWCMAALTPFSPLQEAIRTLDLETYRTLGWAMVFQAARAQLGRGLSVVLDGMARSDTVLEARDLADELGVPSLVILTTCEDRDVQRTRIEGRRREIPGWHELTWEQVEGSRQRWTPPDDVDVILDSTRPVTECLDLVAQALPSPGTKRPASR